MYSEYYRLTDLPFQLGPDPRFFFGSSGHRKAYAYLTYGLHQGEGFIVITGEIGTGKTTLVRHLLSQLNSETYVFGSIVTTQLQADDTLRMVASAFGIPYQGIDKASLLDRLEDFLLATHDAGKHAVLLVDEAQNLPVASLEELRMLSNFEVARDSLLQSFLLGQPQFRATLASPALDQLRQRVIASYHLGPLSAEETRAYIEHRLKTVGWEDDPQFTAEAFADIHAATGGVPRRINSLCSRLLLYGFLEETHVIDAEVVAEVSRELAEELPTNGDATSRRQAVNGGHGVDLDDLADRVTTLEHNVRDHSRTIKRVFQLALQDMEHPKP